MTPSTGHPRKYHTIEEQQQAHTASSARCHEQYKASINHERCCKHQTQRGNQSNTQPSVHNAKPTKTLANMMLEHIAHMNDEFMVLIKHQPHAYADRLFLAFMATVTTETLDGDDSQICDGIMKIGELIDSVDKHKATILNVAGVRQELAEAHEYQDCMEEVQKWLEDILCCIMEGINVLIQTHKSCGLLYQCVVHSVA
ncbi:hypothetical protein EDD18DRAFT_1116061 [Armillaria luteobubalina]|uniref:Uncharacterized protein n=1 Tax=Armillaria luteobubalina TaxID=153913 RepID=A0AA39P0N1_9AGAR|nr:hypothetical protein EDD18DRAFT_1116061 [Armillaria luteobubalina]